MKPLISALHEAFLDILKFKNLKVIIVSSFLVILFWVGVGYLIWDFLIAIGAKILEFVPFSLIKSDGAWMLSSFLWFQVVLITFALVYALFGNMVLQKVSKERYRFFAFATVLISAIFWTIVWYFIGDEIYNQFLKLMAWLPFETLQKGLSFLIGLYIIYNAIIVTLVFIASIFSAFLVDANSKKAIFASLKYSIKDTAIFILLSILAFPLLFIPIVNILTQIVLWVWLIKDTLSFDALLLNFNKIDKELLKKEKFAVYFITFITVLFNFLPIFNIFGPFFGEIAMYKYFKSIAITNKK